MKIDNPFDQALETRNPSMPVRGALVDVADTLQYAWDAARAVFEQDARPEHAVEIARLMLDLIERRRAED